MIFKCLSCFTEVKHKCHINFYNLTVFFLRMIVIENMRVPHFIFIYFL